MGTASRFFILTVIVIVTAMLVASSVAAPVPNKITPLRATLAGDEGLIKLCVGNVLKTKNIPKASNIPDVKLNLNQHKKFNCGPSKSILG
ncbi:hypothetical protein BGX24_005639, partial [Mortierella sp. AD032]